MSDITVQAGSLALGGDLTIPEPSQGLAVFVHGSGGATHLFQEPGKLEQVAGCARGWFLEHLKGAQDAPLAE